jgi:hypothetical protein
MRFIELPNKENSSSQNHISKDQRHALQFSSRLSHGPFGTGTKLFEKRQHFFEVELNSTVRLWSALLN